ncbi:MAG: urease accessory protein UreE [Alphaproteobacteria bacterium]|nr:urease accessory protein UreE [Alphaproteobacteria bacterium]
MMMHIAQNVTKLGPEDTFDGEVTLNYEARFLRRRRLVSDSGEAFLVELPETRSLEMGDGFILDDGRIFRVQPATEPLVRVADDNLARIAWHIGNRHTPCQIMGDHLLIRQDHVLEDMLQKLGAKLEPVNAPFTPEGGAYGHGRTHSHDHH